MKRKKFFCRALTILVLIIISLSLVSCTKRNVDDEPVHIVRPKHFSTEHYYCTLEDEYLTITGLTPAAKELEEITIPVYIADKCVTELIIDEDIEESSIKKIFIRHPIFVDYIRINRSDIRFIYNFDPNFDESALFTFFHNLGKDLIGIENYLEEFAYSRAIISPEMMLQFVQTFLASSNFGNTEDLEKQLDALESEIYDYDYYNKITNVSYRYNLESYALKYYWADFAFLDEGIQPPPDPVIEGYIFGGWYRDEALTEMFDFDGVASPYQEPLLLYAKWVSRG